MKVHAAGASIEGEKVAVATRKFVPFPPRFEEKLQRTLYCFKLNIHGEAEVVEELCPCVAVIDATSQLKQGDAVSGTTLWVMSGKPVKFALQNSTAGHKGQAGTARAFAYARIDAPLRQVTQMLPKL